MGVTIDGVRTADLPDLGSVADGSSFVAEYAGTGRHGAIALRDYINATRTPSVKDYPFYAKGDGATDDTAAIQAAVTACANGALYFPPGTYKITSAQAITGSISIYGAGKTLSVLQLAANGITGFDVTSPSPVNISGMQISVAGGVTGTTGIVINAATYNTETVMRDLQMTGLAAGIDTENGSNWICDGVFILMFTTVGIKIRNTLNPDSGDSSISNCTFIAAGATQSSVQQQSSGGLKISNSKFLSGLYGYVMELDAGISTGDLLFSNCSFEGQAGASISLGQAGAGSNFHSVEITGCQFNLTLQAIAVVNAFATPGWITDLSISGGSMWINAGGTGINLDGVTGFSISGVDFYSLGAAVTCVNITNHSATGLVAPMNYFGAGFSNYVVNNGNSVTVQPKIQKGNGTTNTASGYGTALFAGTSGVITFPRAYLGATPKVFVTPNLVGVGGAISAFAVNVGLTGFQAQVVGAANASPIAYDWVAMGDW